MTLGVPPMVEVYGRPDHTPVVLTNGAPGKAFEVACPGKSLARGLLPNKADVPSRNCPRDYHVTLCVIIETFERLKNW